MSNIDDAVVADLADARPRLAAEHRRAWLRRVRGCPELTHAQRNVVCALGDYADYRDGTNAHPGEVKLADECGLTTRAVRAALARAQELGLIERTAAANPRTGRAAVYRLIAPTVNTGTTVPVNNPTITGTAVPVIDATTGTTVPVNNFNTGTATSSIPEQPFLPPTNHLPNNPGVSPNWGTSPVPLPDTHIDPISSPFCDRHPNGTRDKCGDCGNARTAFNAAKTASAAAEHAAIAADELERRRRRRIIDDCHECDDFGRLDDLSACPHSRLPRAGNA